MRASILAGALLVAGTAHAQYNDPSQATPQTAPPVTETTPAASDMSPSSGQPAADTGTPDSAAAAPAPTTPQLADSVALPKCSRKVTDRCAERR